MHARVMAYGTRLPASATARWGTMATTATSAHPNTFPHGRLPNWAARRMPADPTPAAARWPTLPCAIPSASAASRANWPNATALPTSMEPNANSYATRLSSSTSTHSNSLSPSPHCAIVCKWVYQLSSLQATRCMHA